MSDSETVPVANAVLTFVDEQGREWLAGAMISELYSPRPDGSGDDTLDLGTLKDRAFVLRKLDIVRESS